MKIDAIQNGIVIDHIEKGKGMEIFNYLKLDDIDCPVALIKNAPSKKSGNKDIIKIDGQISLDLDVLGYLSPNAVVNIIQDGVIIEKKRIQLPETLTNVIKCQNPRCITSVEQELKHVFKLSDRENRVYRCLYCETKACD